MAKQESKQIVYSWKGLDRSGKRVSGDLTAATLPLAKASLRRSGINPTNVKKKPVPLFARTAKISTQDIAVFARQLSTMLSAGVPLVQGFDIVAKGHENPAMQDLLLRVKADIEDGNTLADALGKHPRHFNELFVSLVAAGEQAGVLEELLEKIATYLEKTEILKKKVKKALTYPIAVVTVGMLVMVILMVFVVPQFEAMFKDFGADLPVFTQMVVNASEFMQVYWWMIIGGIIGAVSLLGKAYRTSVGVRHGVDRLLLKLPIIGVVMTKSILARFSRTLSTMFAAGVPLVEALKSVANTSGNVVYSDAIMRVREEVSSGIMLHASLENSGVFPHMVTQMVSIGEESGSLDTMLSKAAEFYEEEVDTLVDSLSSLIEPFVMVFLGVIVGGLVLAMYLPIFQMGSVI